MRHTSKLDAGKREKGDRGAKGATVSHSCLASHCLGSEQVMTAGKASVWDAVSDLFMQPRVSAGLWCSIKQWSDLKLTVEPVRRYYQVTAA